MLKTNKPIYKAILILNLLFIVAGVILCLVGMKSPDTNISRLICLVSAIACLIFAAFYILSGYTKNDAKYYKVFGALLAIKYLVDLLSGSINLGIPFGMMIRILSLVIVLVLLFSQNLGKNKSLVLCGLFVILRVALLLYAISKGITQNVFMIGNIVNIDLACLYGIMTYAKYLDKEARGTK